MSIFHQTSGIFKSINMRELILKELKLENFQKFKNETFEFGAVETHIHGENRAGKTTVQSAMLWLLFGKDANGFTDTGRGAFDIKRRDKDGEVVHADVTVEGTFLLDGEKVVLKRVLHENYTKKGDYTGDETQCFVNCTPYQLGEYKKYIEGIISEEEFRMITNIEYFLSLKTDFQRKYLCTMGGVQSVEDICKDNQQWKAFLDTLSGKTIEDALKQIAYERKELKKQYEKIPVSIQSLEKVKPEPMDWEALEADKEGLNALLEDVNESISDGNKAMESTANEIAGLMKQSSEKRKEFYQLTKDLQEAKHKAREEAYRELEQKNESRRRTLSQMDAAKRTLDDKRCELQVLTKSVEEMNKDMQVCFEEYQKLQESTFQYDEKQNICPLLHNHVCDSPALLAYLEKNREKAEADFHVSKEKKIQEKLAEGKAIRIERDETKETIEEIKLQIERMTKEIEALESVLGCMPDYTKQTIDEDSLAIPGKEEINLKMQRINKELSDIDAKINELESKGKPDHSQLIARRNELSKQLETVIRNLSLKEQIEKIDKEIEALNKEGDRLAEQISTLETKEAIAKEINKAVVEDATERVNRLFTIVKWQMFEQQKNGEYAEVCKPTIDGVSKSLNREAKINAGIDICNAISRFKGFSAPLFIDNHESVNKSIPTVGQTIKCYVAPQGTKLNIQIIK